MTTRNDTLFPDTALFRALGEAISQGTLLKPLCPMAVTFDGWIASLNGGADSRRLKPVRDYANRLYQQAITEVLDGARDLEKTKVIPSRYVLAATEMIGQDQANDVSHIFLVKQRPGGEPRMTALVRNARI